MGVTKLFSWALGVACLLAIIVFCDDVNNWLYADDTTFDYQEAKAYQRAPEPEGGRGLPAEIAARAAGPTLPQAGPSPAAPPAEALSAGREAGDGGTASGILAERPEEAGDARRAALPSPAPQARQEAAEGAAEHAPVAGDPVADAGSPTARASDALPAGPPDALVAFETMLGLAGLVPDLTAAPGSVLPRLAEREPGVSAADSPARLRPVEVGSEIPYPVAAGITAREVPAQTLRNIIDAGYPRGAPIASGPVTGRLVEAVVATLEPPLQVSRALAIQSGDGDEAVLPPTALRRGPPPPAPPPRKAGAPPAPTATRAAGNDRDARPGPAKPASRPVPVPQARPSPPNLAALARLRAFRIDRDGSVVSRTAARPGTAGQDMAAANRRPARPSREPEPDLESAPAVAAVAAEPRAISLPAFLRPSSP
ncbi:hypothetical protein OPKNFCMD_5279 [Methylobacterium crusticola]|uniref:Uncharacterized protein n=1 Tax=Methylobacterium crusticola TaxID=1697972 RepID=A0ABQ4R4E2_9HYPH|nr:hypothetical protein [Methylobacterium crusticola]GJD52513.1 hypothetical protein OPKNFCMD_5279 [Methylobacterium crusticola]